MHAVAVFATTDDSPSSANIWSRFLPFFPGNLALSDIGRAAFDLLFESDIDIKVTFLKKGIGISMSL
jgi:hypothetical protein